MSKITNDGLIRSGTGCFMVVYPYGNSRRQRVDSKMLWIGVPRHVSPQTAHVWCRASSGPATNPSSYTLCVQHHRHRYSISIRLRRTQPDAGTGPPEVRRAEQQARMRVELHW